MNNSKITFKKGDVKAHFAGHWRTFYDHYLELKNGNGNEYQAICPFHPDSDPSLSINNESGLFHCFGCNTQGDAFVFYSKLKGIHSFPKILQGIGDEFGITGSATNQKRTGKAKIEATYNYTDEMGLQVFQVVRFEPKDFRQRRPDGKGGWIWNLKGVNRVLYRLPEITEAEQVVICEGERDVDNLVNLGFTATTCAGGAGKWRPEYNDALKDKDVVILPDNDEPGNKHADQVAKALQGVARSIKVLELPGLPEKGDVSDWIEIGGTKEALHRLIDQADEWKPDQDVVDIKKQFPRGPFPWDVLPSGISESLKQLARSCATSPTSLPGAAIAIFASTIGCRVDVSPKQSWKEPLIFWVGDVRPSGAGKTPAARALCQVLYNAQDLADKKYQEAFDEWKSLPKKEREAQNEPARPRGYFTTSLTIEGLHADHSGHGGKVCILDELSSFISAQNQYKAKGNDREAWLCLFDGKPARIVRVKESKTIRGARVSIFGGIQPEVWISAFSGRDGQVYLSDGTIYRFLPTYEGTGFHPLTLEAWGDENRTEWEATLKTAMKWADDQEKNKTICLNSEAKGIFLDWRNGLYQIMEDFPEAVRGFIPKLVGAALRFAGVLYLLDAFSLGREPGAVLNVGYIANGIRVSEFYLGHIIEAMEALVSKNAVAPFEMTDQVIHLAETLQVLQPKLDNGKLAVGFIQKHFNQTCGQGLAVKSPHLMGSILRRCGLTITGGVHNANGKRAVKCLQWDKKTNSFIESCLSYLTSLHRQEYSGLTGADNYKQKSDLSAPGSDSQGSLQTSQTLKKSYLQDETCAISGFADNADKSDNFSKENKKPELDFTF